LEVLVLALLVTGARNPLADLQRVRIGIIRPVVQLPLTDWGVPMQVHILARVVEYGSLLPLTLCAAERESILLLR
jgi:hypothetical protein